MNVAFDDTALNYDVEFTHTPIGKLQRENVWRYLEAAFEENFPDHVLELNCGTGEDALFFARHKSDVLATDVSEKMLGVTNKKIIENGFNKVKTKRLDISSINDEVFTTKFDLVFSNFGGLNCVDAISLKGLFQRMAAQLNPGGRMILVIMPRFCAWESIYFLSRFRFGKAFRRRKKIAQEAVVGKERICVWYYDPKDIVLFSSPYFEIKHIQPVGIAVPPSYLGKTLISNNRILKKLGAAEKKLNKFKLLSRMADHFLIDLELK